MRYCVIPKGLSLAQVEAEVKKSGGTEIKIAPWSEMLFAELDNDALTKLQAVSGLAVKNIGKTHADVMPPPIPMRTTTSVYAGNLAVAQSKWAEFRELFSPPLTGKGLVCAILGSGIRDTHRALEGKVVHSKNFSDSPTLDDVFDHCTGVAYLIAGGELAEGEECGIAPGARLWSVKVIDDDGNGTVENLIMGMNYVHDMFAQAVHSGLPLGDDMYPNAVNISLGAEDDGDEENPLRLAVEHLYQASPGKFPIFASAGNEPTYATLPAAAEHAWAVGAVRFTPFELCEFSARGSITGLIKPECVFFGENILMASSKSDDAFTTKSGTSFSTPLALGMLCLTREAAERAGTLAELIGLEYEELEPIVQDMSIKPEGMPTGKINGYGYGIPNGELYASLFRAPGVDISSIIGQIVPAMVMVGMMGIMSKTMK